MKNFSISERLTPLQVQQLFELSQQMWWSQKRTMEEILTMLKNSLSFGLIENNTQKLIGYARVLTDEIKYAFIFDIMINDQYRSKGLSKIIMDAIFSHPKLKSVINFDLTCAPDMVNFYKKFNFSENFENVKVMRRTNKTSKFSG